MHGSGVTNFKGHLQKHYHDYTTLSFSVIYLPISPQHISYYLNGWRDNPVLLLNFSLIITAHNKAFAKNPI